MISAAMRQIVGAVQLLTQKQTGDLVGEGHF